MGRFPKARIETVFEILSTNEHTVDTSKGYVIRHFLLFDGDAFQVPGMQRDARGIL